MESSGTVYFFTVICFVMALFQPEVSSKDIFELSENYNKHMPPMKDGQPVVVKAQIVIHQVTEINEVARKMKLHMHAALRWQDPYVRTEEAIVGLGMSDCEKLWKPSVTVLNMLAMIPKSGLHEMIYFYMTKEQWISYFIQFILELPCPFNFEYYPFDIQVCDVNFTMRHYRMQLVKLEWGSMRPVAFDHYNGTTTQHLPLYYIQLCATRREAVYSELTGTFSRLVMRMVLTRDLEDHILCTYLPSTILVMVSWCSFLVAPEVVPGRTVLIVTTLLSLITMYVSNKETSPPSVKVQPLEIWLLMCIVSVFASLAEYAILLFRLRSGTVPSAVKDQTRIVLFGTRGRPMYGDCMEKQDVSDNGCIGVVLKTWRKATGMVIRYVYHPNWKPEDRLSLIIFPVVFVAYAIAYFHSYVSKRAESISTPECM